jgi:hypothetical protein
MAVPLSNAVAKAKPFKNRIMSPIFGNGNGVVGMKGKVSCSYQEINV